MRKTGKLFIVIVAVIFIVILFNISPIVQNIEYHKFEDSKTILSIPNFWNVVSNVSFLIVGIIGLLNLSFFQKHKMQYIYLFIGILLISFGSGYYHLKPNNQTLVWDRLPMTITFMALFSILISEFVNNELGKKLLYPLLFFGFSSILYWLIKHDLRLYVFIQFYPIVIMPVVLICFKTNDNISKGYWVLFVAYIVAKLFEYFDSQIYNLILFSGHSLKHVFSAIGLYCFFKINAFRNDEQLFVSCKK